MLTLTDASLEAILLALTDTGGLFDPADTWLAVATAIVDNGAATTLANITEATGAMGTRKAVTPWGVPYKLTDGRWVVDGPILQFRPASSAETQTLVGFALVDALTAGVLKAFAGFGASYPLPNEDRAVSIIPRLTVDPTGRWSAEIVFNG